MRHFFYMHRNDRLLLVAVAVALLASSVALFFVSRNDVSEPTVTNGEIKGGEITAQKRGETYQYATPNDGNGGAGELFAFDPNTADSTQLLRLGLKPWQVRAIYRYRAKGGIFRSKADFARLYGLTAGQYRRLEPYISIAEDYRPAADVFIATKEPLPLRDTIRYPLKLKKGERISLNTADTTLLKRVPGIGSGFARAIVSYRERLGGFYSTTQLNEISGFPPEAIPYFTADDSECRKLNINELPLSELRRHPYIRFYLAKTIIEHRRTHGNIHSFDELSLYRDFTPEVIERLKHYVRFH